MKAENINPFIESVSEVFQNMLDSKVETGTPTVDIDDKGAPDIIGVIGLSGTAQGIVALRLPVKTALSVIGKMVGTEFRGVDSSIIDGVGELVNIVAGNAKAKFRGHSISLSLPTVVRGSIYKLNNLSNTVWLTVPFDSAYGAFSVSVCFKPAVVSEKEAEHASAYSR
ncbi:putative chemotaxis protein CheX [Candidatus Zixiibacteriota bacterium]|nr:putative chemotaxis protein CheX [candidate division Zixibacteria bacterium]